MYKETFPNSGEYIRDYDAERKLLEERKRKHVNPDIQRRAAMNEEAVKRHEICKTCKNWKEGIIGCCNLIKCGTLYYTDILGRGIWPEGCGQYERNATN